MFPEYRQLITQLKSENAHFSALFQRHNALDQQIQNMEAGIVPASGNDVEVLKKEKLQLKDKLYGIPGPPTDTPERLHAPRRARCMPGPPFLS